MKEIAGRRWQGSGRWRPGLARDGLLAADEFINQVAKCADALYLR